MKWNLSRYLIFELICYALAAAAICMLATGCASNFYGPDGKRTATIRGDYTYQRTAAGAVTITLKHSPVINAAGNATAKVATAGAAALLIK